MALPLMWSIAAEELVEEKLLTPKRPRRRRQAIEAIAVSTGCGIPARLPFSH